MVLQAQLEQEQHEDPELSESTMQQVAAVRSGLLQPSSSVSQLSAQKSSAAKTQPVPRIYYLVWEISAKESLRFCTR
jgi:hypothetical protein